MKCNPSLAAIISTAALTGSVLLASFPAQACPFRDSKGINGMNGMNGGNLASLVSKKINRTQMGIVGAGMATVAGLFVAGVAYRQRRSRQAEAVLAEVPAEHPEATYEAIYEEVLYAPIPKQAS